MKYERLCVAAAVLLTCALPGKSEGDKPADPPKSAVTATRKDNGSVEYRFTFPAVQGDKELAGVELLRWKKGGEPDVSIYIPLKATLDAGKQSYSGSFTLSKELMDLDLAISTSYRGKQGGSGGVQRLADITVQPAKKK
jgi:hypothetical protein